MSRQKERKTRNYLPALLLTLVWWGVLGVVIFFVDPESVADVPITRSYLPFFGAMFLAVWFTSSLILGNTRRGLEAGVGVVLFGYLRLWKMGMWWNGALIVVALVAFEMYFSSKGKEIPAESKEEEI